jgi:ABC-type branched-subunit amino acid transport system ATPase component
MSGHLLVAKGVSKRFGGLVAVDDVSIHVNKGEMVGLIGPNGSGKTTLFDCLSRVQDIDQGRIEFDGVDITKKRPHLVAHLGLSRTFQVIRVYRELTVLENMELSLQWGKVSTVRLFQKPDSSTRDKADQLIDFLLLSRLRNEQAGTLSGGQRRLLEIGMSLMSDPKLVLLDEATSGVNPALVEEIKVRLQILNQEQGVAFLLVEHDVRFVKDLCDRVVVLNYGALLAEGSPQEIMENKDVIEAYFGDDGEADVPVDDDTSIEAETEGAI